MSESKRLPPMPEYARQVQALAAEFLSAAGETVESIPEDEISRAHESSQSVLAAAANGVARLRERRFERGAYDRQEQRVCEYLSDLIPDVGCGMDPVGFLIASHAALLAELREIRPNTAEQ